MTTPTIPTLDEIRHEGERLASALGNAVHQRGSDLFLSLDGKFPGLSDDQAAQLRASCVDTAAAMRQPALTKMWGA